VVVYNTAGVYDVSLETFNQYGSDALTSAGIVNVIDVPVMEEA